MKEISDIAVHGDEGLCPTCGAYGHFDDMKHHYIKNTAVFDDAIFKSKFNDNQWECHNCWLK